MDSQLLQYVTGFGLATQAGGKACIPIFLLGVFHHTGRFTLSENFAWIADPVVMVILGVLILVEMYLDAHPDLGEYMDFLSYLPATVAGFICLATATGGVDSNIAALATSGILGGVTGSASHYLRNKVRSPIRENLEDTDDSVGKGVTIGETATTATLGVSFIIWPLVAVVSLVAVALCAWLILRKVNSRRTPCGHCGQPMRTRARVCPHCKMDQ